MCQRMSLQKSSIQGEVFLFCQKKWNLKFCERGYNLPTISNTDKNVGIVVLYVPYFHQILSWKKYWDV